MMKNWNFVILSLSAPLAFAGAGTAWASPETPKTYACSVSAMIGKKPICAGTQFTLPLHPTRDGLSGLASLPEACRPLNNSQVSVELNTERGLGRASLKGLQGDSLKPIGQTDLEFDAQSSQFTLGVTQEAGFLRREKQIKVHCADPDQIPAALIFAPVEWNHFYALQISVSQPLVIRGHMNDNQIPDAPVRLLSDHYTNSTTTYWLGKGSDLANHDLWIAGIRNPQSVESAEVEITLLDELGGQVVRKAYSFSRSLNSSTQFKLEMKLIEHQN